MGYGDTDLELTDMKLPVCARRCYRAIASPGSGATEQSLRYIGWRDQPGIVRVDEHHQRVEQVHRPNRLGPAGPSRGASASGALVNTAPAVDADDQRHADDGDDELDCQLEPVDTAGCSGDAHRAGEERSDGGGDHADDDRQPDRDVLPTGQDDRARAPMMAPITIAVMIPVTVMCFSIHVVVGGRLPA